MMTSDLVLRALLAAVWRRKPAPATSSFVIDESTIASIPQRPLYVRLGSIADLIRSR